MSSILSNVPPPDNAELDAMIALLLDGELIVVGSKGKMAECLLGALFDYRKLRGAAQPHPGHTTSHFPGGDERAAARPVPMTAEYFTAVLGFAPQDDDLDRINCDKAGEFGHSRCGWCDRCNKPRFHCPHFLTHPAPTSLGVGHAELAPAADPPPTPLGSAVGSPGAYPCAGELQVRGTWYPCEVLGPVQNEEASGYRIKREGIPREFAVLAYRVRFQPYQD